MSGAIMKINVNIKNDKGSDKKRYLNVYYIVSKSF